MKISSIRGCFNRGFGRVDAITLGFSLLAFGSVIWAGLWVGGEKRRIWVCQHHLKQLGQAFASYTLDHGGNLPPAFFDDGKTSNSWDGAIAVYLPSTLDGKTFAGDLGELKAKVAPVFKCPSDPGPRGSALARSYAMPVYDINLVGWPPESDSQGGLGLYLDNRTLRKAHQAIADEASESVPAINISLVQNPAETALLVERIASGNILFNPKYASIASTREQLDNSSVEAKNFHGGRMNYLLLDGHVELLFPAQSAGFTGNGGFWTLWPDD